MHAINQLPEFIDRVKNAGAMPLVTRLSPAETFFLRGSNWSTQAGTCFQFKSLQR